MVVAPARRRSHQDKCPDIARALGRIQQRKKAAPRVAYEEQTVDPPLPPQGIQVGYMIAPPDPVRLRYLRSPAAALVVEADMELVSETTEGRKKVIVLGPRTAVQHGHRRPTAGLPNE